MVTMHGLKHLMVCALLGLGLISATPASARADAEAEGAVRAWVEAVGSGDMARVSAILAPEFQILRPDGRGHEKADYLTGGAARITDIHRIDDLVATRHDDLLVVRYVLSADGAVDGRRLQAKAPRLTVFRRDGDRWLVVAHANFARIE